jgi:hypothetical protein
MKGEPLASAEYATREPNYFETAIDRRSNFWKVTVDNVRTYYRWAGYLNVREPEAPTSQV